MPLNAEGLLARAWYPSFVKAETTCSGVTSLSDTPPIFNADGGSAASGAPSEATLDGLLAGAAGSVDGVVGADVVLVVAVVSVGAELGVGWLAGGTMQAVERETRTERRPKPRAFMNVLYRSM